MTGSKYIDVDVPFCVKCSRFCVKRVGEVWVALNHEKDEKLTVRSGMAYKCPQCGCIVIHKWLSVKKMTKWKFEKIKYWKIYLEDHIHKNKFHANQ